jgi:hypothetical protein
MHLQDAPIEFIDSDDEDVAVVDPSQPPMSPDSAKALAAAEAADRWEEQRARRPRRAAAPEFVDMNGAPSFAVSAGGLEGGAYKGAGEGGQRAWRPRRAAV